MLDWLMNLVRDEESSDEGSEGEEEPAEGTGRVVHYSRADRVGVVELESGREVAFGGYASEGRPEEGAEVHASEMFRHETFGWAADEVVPREVYEAGEAEASSDEEESTAEAEAADGDDGWTPPPPEYPPVDEVRAKIEELSERLHPGFASAAAPSVFLRPIEETNSARTRFQGRPLVAPEVEWPESPEGPMWFMGQIDFAELREVHQGAIEGLPKRGVLALFTSKELWVNTDDEAYWELTYLKRPEEGRLLEPPREELDQPEVGAERVLYPTLPGAWDRYAPEPRPDDAPGLIDDIEDALWEFAAEWSPSPRHHVGGQVEWIQYDARERCEKRRRGDEEAEISEEEAARWRLLWAYDSDPHTCGDLWWGDTGRLYLMIREDDLAGRNFDRVEPVVQGH